jgi:hypothetical protein
MKGIIASLLLFMSNDALSQDDTLWRTGGLTSLTFNQVSLTNWAAGGDNLIGGQALLSLYARFKNNQWTWNSSVDVAFGGSKTGKQQWQKSDDRIDLRTSLGYLLSRHLSIGYQFGFNTQFTEGFHHSNNMRHRISHFLTPGYLINSLGTEWQHQSGLWLYLSPLTVKTTLLKDQLLIDRSATSGTSLFGVKPGKKIRNETGAFFFGRYKKSLMEKVVFSTRLELFSNYSDNPENIDINWEVLITLRINQYLHTLISTQLLYDDDVHIPKEETNALPGPGTQFKFSFGIGLTYQFEKAGAKN